MKRNITIAILSVFGMTFLHAENAEQPMYYEDYLKSLEEPVTTTEEEETADVAVVEEEEATADDILYYEDYVNSLTDQYEQSDSDTTQTTARTEEVIAESKPGFDSAIAQAFATSIPQSEINMPKLSEAFGNFLGKNLKNSGIHFEIDNLVTGLRNGIADKPSPLTETEYESMMVAVQQQAFEKLSSDNLRKADLFMVENAHNPRVIELVPGKLQYLLLKSGSGTAVEEENTPLINYTGKYLDGTVFSSSEETGGAITIPLSHTIPGFQKGITGMHEGEKRRLFIHPDQGYGASAGHLPPNSLLIFDIDIVEAHHEEDEVDDIDDSDVEPSDEDIDYSDVEDEEPDRMMQGD